MSCAGCDDCPDTHWHLHVTVDKPDGVWSDTWKQYFSEDCIRVGAKAVRVTNVFHADNNQKWVDPRTLPKGVNPYVTKSYEELIPTVNYHGSETEAARNLFNLGVAFVRMGYRVVRLKMEASPNVASEKRMLYAETHVKVKNIMGARARASILYVPMSIVGVPVDGEGYFIITGREPTIGHCHSFIDHMKKEFTYCIVEEPRVEICTHDTNPELDKAWLSQ